MPTGNWIDYRASSYAGGSGTESDPYLISTPEQLALLSYDASNFDTYYAKITTSIDLDAHYWTPKNVARGLTLNGTNNRILNLRIDPSSTYTSGLFADANHLDIKNIIFYQARIYHTSSDKLSSFPSSIGGIIAASIYCGSIDTITLEQCDIEIETPSTYIPSVSYAGLLTGKEDSVTSVNNIFISSCTFYLYAESMKSTSSTLYFGTLSNVVGTSGTHYYKNIEISGLDFIIKMPNATLYIGGLYGIFTGRYTDIQNVSINITSTNVVNTGGSCNVGNVVGYTSSADYDIRRMVVYSFGSLSTQPFHGHIAGSTSTGTRSNIYIHNTSYDYKSMPDYTYINLSSTNTSGLSTIQFYDPLLQPALNAAVLVTTRLGKDFCSNYGRIHITSLLGSDFTRAYCLNRLCVYDGVFDDHDHFQGKTVNGLLYVIEYNDTKSTSYTTVLESPDKHEVYYTVMCPSNNKTYLDFNSMGAFVSNCTYEYKNNVKSGSTFDYRISGPNRKSLPDIYLIPSYEKSDVPFSFKLSESSVVNTDSIKYKDSSSVIHEISETKTKNSSGILV